VLNPDYGALKAQLMVRNSQRKRRRVADIGERPRIVDAEWLKLLEATLTEWASAEDAATL
jgi:hypothetical protein